jgi:hypothetical protein
MIDLNKQKQEEIKGFLPWLEGAQVEALANKTKIQAYQELELEEMLTNLKNNKRKLPADPARRAFQEDLAAEF